MRSVPGRATAARPRAEPSLTHDEIPLLPQPFNLTDGHVHRRWSPAEAAVIARSAEIFASVNREQQPELEAKYIECCLRFHRQTHDPVRQGHMICLTASEALEIVANHLRLGGYSLALVEPCFDNLANIFSRHDVPLAPLPDHLLEEPGLARYLSVSDASAICLVSPNNPTGRTLTRECFELLLDHCRRRGVLLVLDASFRAYTPPEQAYDQYAMLIDSGIDYVVIEDTGKTWPTLELKAAIMSCSRSLLSDLFDIYTDFLLHVSPFTLRLLTEMVELSIADGGAYLRAVVDTNRGILERALRGGGLALVGSPSLSVAWAEVAGLTGDAFASRLADAHVHVLAGGRFYWSDPARGRSMVRIALTRDADAFAQAAEIVGSVSRSLTRECSGGAAGRQSQPSGLDAATSSSPDSA